MTENANGSPAVRVFISYSHDNPEHRSNILGLAQELRRAGVDAWIDQFVETAPPLSWPLWMNEQIDQSDFVLVVITETYARRFMNREAPGKGLGVRWEGAIITSALYHASSDRVKFVPVVVRSSDSMHIPPPLLLTTRYNVGTIDHRNLEPLLRHLLNEPAVILEPIGPVVNLRPTGAPAGSAPETEPFRSTIEAAIARAKVGDRDGGIAELEKLLDGTPREIAASAAYNLGLIWQEDDAYSNSITAYQRAIELWPGSPTAEAAINNLQLVIQVMNAHYGPEGPVHAAREWLELIRDGEYASLGSGFSAIPVSRLRRRGLSRTNRTPTCAGWKEMELAGKLSQAKPTHHLSRARLGPGPPTRRGPAR